MAVTTKSAVAAAIIAGLQTIAHDKNQSLERKDIHATASAVTDKVAPILISATNSEAKWYQKRSVWSAIVSVGVTILSPYAVKYGIPTEWISDANREMVIDVLVQGGAALSAYLTWRAGRPGIKPLGSK